MRQQTTLSPIRVSVFEYRADDDFIAGISRDLRTIQAANPGVVQFTFYDGKNSQVLQNQDLDRAIREGTDLIFLNLVDVTQGQPVINKIKENNLPVVLYNREPVTQTPIKSYSKALFIGNDPRAGGILQGQLIIDLWNARRQVVDKNNDGIIQYVMLSGGLNNLEAMGRTEYSIKTVENAGIRTQQLALREAFWDENLARRAIETLYFRYGNYIELIISNDDTMAIGAIQALQEYGYNTGDPARHIPVIGFDAEEQAVQLINQGVMTGTVIQSTYLMAEAMYIIGMNLLFGRPLLQGTPYVFDETGVSIRIPYGGVLLNLGN